MLAFSHLRLPKIVSKRSDVLGAFPSEDLFGLIAIVTIEGKHLLQDLMNCDALDWGSPLSEEREAEWTMWKYSLQHLKEFEIPISYTPSNLCNVQWRELHVFSDASVKAIVTVAHIKVTDSGRECYVGFVLGKAKLEPPAVRMILRLEVGVAVLAAEVGWLV